MLARDTALLKPTDGPAIQCIQSLGYKYIPTATYFYRAQLNAGVQAPIHSLR